MDKYICVNMFFVIIFLLKVKSIVIFDKSECEVEEKAEGKEIREQSIKSYTIPHFLKQK